ncbi:RNA-guided endonuclease TnpB family protein [Actinomadura sp. 7K507]|uniref:RNA-guided endonuclease InsQ/TnpB family protein n=1 Tax=Actinomadura sp. 7K507 TaxID=2530365 RepID=UPI001049FDCE|nr:RNA-guided endonuclease TnpB family protein [Actinomadura sp. 7K507]TDC75815.1 transposase [Actinomadura sp. 7K507]
MADADGEDGGGGNARYSYRLRLSSTAERALLAEWDRCRWVWNECVARSRAAHRAGEACGPAGLDRMLTGWRSGKRWLGAGASVPQQQVIRDFGKSRAKALKDIAKGLPVKQRAGLPRFKKRGLAAPTLNYTRRGFRLTGGRLRLAGGIVVTVVWSRDLPAAPSSVRISRDCLGHWYASFVVPAQPEPLPAAGRVIGVDWGVTQVATTTSDTHDLPHPEHGRKAADKLARYQRQMARRRAPKGKQQSQGYRAAQRQAAKAAQKVACQRQDDARKWAKKVARDFDAVAVEDFRPKFLAKSTMARKAADAAIGQAKKALIEMGRKHCRDVRLVDPAYTTMDCGHCGARAKHRLPQSERIYTCTACGTSRPRDKNSARVMLVRAGLAPDGADGARPPAPPGREAA